MSDLDKKAQGEVKTPTITSQSSGPAVGEVYNEHEHEHEPFAASPNGVNFRTVGWIRASIFFLKMTFAAGILSITPALYELGAVLGAIMILFWGLLNTYMAVIQGQFKMHHPSVHTVSDSAHIAAMELTGGKKGCARMAREVTEFIYILAWILAAGLSILGLSTAFNAVTHHETCTALSLASAHASSSRLSEACGRSISPFDLGFSPWIPPTAAFATIWSAACIIFASSANTSGYVPVISEMRNPRDYFKSIYLVMTWIISSYMVIGLVMFWYAGRWIATSALGSAGPTIKIVSYAIGIPGLIAGATICVHVAAKSIFVRILRGSPHLTSNTWQHWGVWLSTTYGAGIAGWLICKAIPFYGSLVSIIGSGCFGPLGICLPIVLWFCMNRGARTGSVKMRVMWWGHMLLLLLGVFTTVGGIYSAVVQIPGQFRTGDVGSPFQCADNSNTVSS